MSAEILLPVGRMLGGSVYKPVPVIDDATKLQKVNARGELRAKYKVVVGIPKGAEQHWNQTEWGAKIWAEGAAAFPAHHALPTFFWKIHDGDAPWVNDDGETVEMTERRRHWVIRTETELRQPILCNDKGESLTTEDAIVPGYFVQIVIDVLGNGAPKSQGVYVNPLIVAFIAFGAKIASGTTDTKKFTFGGALPAGASMTPVAAFNPAPVAKPAPAPVPAVPNYAILQPPSQSVVVTPPPAPAGPQMTALAQAPYDVYIAAGWTDEQLRSNGLML